MHGATRIFASTIATGAVEIVLCVSGFAQSNTAYRAVTAADHTSTLALREYVVAAHPPADAASLPRNLIAPASYRDLLERMLQRSVTFRRQCLRLAHTPDLTVTLQTAGMPRPAHMRARARIVRRGVEMIASIEVLRLDDPVELIAHEIEHVIEQLDGVDLASRASIGATGVHGAAGDEDSFETTRAIRVGLAVAAEVRRTGG